MGQNTIKKRTIGLIVFVVLIALIVGIFAAIATLQWWVATISALAVPVVIAVGMVAAIVGYQNFNTQIQDLRTPTSPSTRRDQKTRRDNPPPSTAAAKDTTVSPG
jgi:c-di-AMP phosphodiesterase-like protein